MFAIGFLLFVPAVAFAFFVGAAKIDIPEWVELLGGGAILFGAILMLGSGLWHAAPFLWRAMP